MSENIEKAIEKLNAKLQGAVIKRLDDVSLKVQYAPSGILMLDRLCGGSGLPLGRITELYGPEGGGKTTLACLIAASWQKQGKRVAYIDMEHRMDEVWMGKLGLNPEQTYILRPDSGTAGLNALATMVESNLFDLIIFDSVAAIVSESEMENNITKQEVSVVARLLGDVIRRLNPMLSKTSTSLIFINQVRTKVGVMYGCVNGETLVNFTDGRAIPIKTVVEQKIQGNVWSYNEQTHKIEEKPIIGWHDNGIVKQVSDWVSITTEGLTKNGVASITVTPDHKVLTPTGWKEAKDITINDKLMTKYEDRLNGTLREFLLGTIIGDCALSVRARNTACIKLQDTNNSAYAIWKKNKLNKYFGFTELTTKNTTRYASTYRHDLAILKAQLTNRNPLMALSDASFSKLSLALWYMDDGHFDNSKGHCRSNISIKRYSDDTNLLSSVCLRLKSLFNLDSTYDKRGTITFDKKNTLLLHSLIATYVPSCMQYKLDAAYQGKYVDFELHSTNNLVLTPVQVLHINIGSKRKFRLKHKYDLSIQDNPSFMAGSASNGVIIHNSPETTPGGRALAYFSTLRFAVNKLKDKASCILDDDGKYIAHTIRVRNVKNSVGSPELEGTFMLHYGPAMKGPDNMSALLALAVEKQIIEKGGGGMYRVPFNGQVLSYKGEVALIAGIKSNPQILEWLVKVLNLNQVYVQDILGNNNINYEETSLVPVDEKPKTK